MSRSKSSSFLIIFMLITVGSFVAGLEAQDSEENSTSLQEFVKKAEEYVKQNQIGEAIELYKRIVIAAPEDEESRLQLATLYTRTKQHEKAAETYSKLLEVDSDNIMYQDELVTSLQAAGKQNEALEIAQTYIRTYPEEGIHYARIAKLYDADGDEAAVIENYKKATAFGYGDKKIYLKLAEHYFFHDDLGAVENALNNALIYTTSSWDKERIERQLVNLYLYQGNLEEMLQKSEAEGTLTYEMQKHRARHFRNIGELEKSANAFKKALKMTSSPYQQNVISNELLNVYLKQNRVDLALGFYEAEAPNQIISTLNAIRFSSSGMTVMLGGDDMRKTLINEYKNQGQLDVLKTYFEGKLEKDTTNRAIIEMLAEIYWETSEYQKAAEAYHLLSKARSVAGRHIRSYYYAAAAFHKSNQPDMMEAVLNEATLASKNDRPLGTFLGALASFCLKNEMYDQATKLTVIAVSKAEAADDTFELEYLYEILAKSYLAVKRYEDAFETYQKMAEMAKEDNEGSLQERAEKAMNEAAKSGKLFEKWIPEQLKLVEENPNDPKRILKLAQSYEATENIKMAVDQYERLVELDPENAQWYERLGELYQSPPEMNRETGPASEKLNAEQLEKSIDAYEKATEFEPTLYKLYDLLAQTLMKAGKTSQAKETYRSALDAPLGQNDHDSAILAIIGLFADEGQEEEQIAFLEDIRQKLGKMDQSAILHELLGDLYKKVSDVEKAERAYAKWLRIQQKTLNSTQSASSYSDFVDRLLDKDLYPAIALKFAKRAFHKATDLDYTYPENLGYACIANGLYDEALRHFKHALNLISDEHYSDMFWEEIAAAIKNANDKERYIQMLSALISSIPLAYPNKGSNFYRIIADFYDENDLSENAEKFLLKNGFIPETCWITLGPFKNIDSRGVLYAYIPEETTQIDATAKYYGRDQLISWEKPSDDILDGRFDFGNKDGINDSSAAYAWAVIISPGERDIVLRFDSDDQGLVWLNGKKVFEHFRTSGVQLDRYTFSVTLKKGENTLLVKVGNAWLAWDFYLRLTDADGKPYGDLKFKNADALLSAPPPKSTFHLNVNLGMAEYYSKNNMPDKAMEQMRQTGMIHEKKWWVLGPFDNSTGIGYNTAYIREDTTQIDLTAKYEGVGEQIGWKEFTDDAFDGFIDLGRNVNWRVSYALTTVISPDERKVQLRFGSDDQSKVWFNGNKVFADPRFRWAVVDSDIIPVTLKKGINTILVKVCNEERTWGFYLRVTDADGKPFEDLKYNSVQENQYLRQ